MLTTVFLDPDRVLQGYVICIMICHIKQGLNKCTQFRISKFAYLSQVFAVVSEILGGFLQSLQGHPIVAFFAPTREVHSAEKWLLH